VTTGPRQRARGWQALGAALVATLAVLAQPGVVSALLGASLAERLAALAAVAAPWVAALSRPPRRSWRERVTDYAAGATDHDGRDPAAPAPGE
jgi:hypothetical protein